MTKTLTAEQLEKLEKIREAEIPAKHTGWRSVIQFNLWEKHGHRRLYYAFKHYDRNGRSRDYARGKGYVDLKSGEVKAPPSDTGTIVRLLVLEGN